MGKRRGGWEIDEERVEGGGVGRSADCDGRSSTMAGSMTAQVSSRPGVDASICSCADATLLLLLLFLLSPP